MSLVSLISLMSLMSFRRSSYQVRSGVQHESDGARRAQCGLGDVGGVSRRQRRRGRDETYPAQQGEKDATVREVFVVYMLVVLVVELFIPIV
jgi:hypothetical protein